jgi:hypothetical protein
MGTGHAWDYEKGGQQIRDIAWILQQQSIRTVDVIWFLR